MLLCAVCVTPFAVQAQSRAWASGRSEVFAGSELERYLRVLQVEGLAGEYPWSLRAFSAGELDRMGPRWSSHPWVGRYDLGARRVRGLRLDLVAPTVSLWSNSAFPFGGNDGPVWQGRGVTVAATAGVAIGWGPLSVTFAPQVFRAQNSDFALLPVDTALGYPWADPRFPPISEHARIDRPQRFGDAPYSRQDPGQSTARLDVLGISLGVSTANELWGPADQYPLVLGNHAPGFPHLFLGTSRPRDLWLVRAHGRLVWGELRRSPFAGPEYDPFIGYPVDTTRRFMSGLVLTVQPRGIAGLEVGLARFFHTPWPRTGLEWGDYLKPLSGLLKAGLPDEWIFLPGSHGDPDNQLASAFMRWVLPGSGFEVYGEYAREDHSWDLRDFLSEPEQSSAFLVGARKTWARRDGSIWSLRGEVVDAQQPGLIRGRGGYPFYVHLWVLAGHTERGQVLGSDAAALGGAGMSLKLERYTRRGRVSISYESQLRASQAAYHWGGQVEPRGRDYQHAFGIECLRFVGPFDVLLGVTGVRELNRDFRRDASNLHLTLGVRARM